MADTPSLPGYTLTPLTPWSWHTDGKPITHLSRPNGMFARPGDLVWTPWLSKPRRYVGIDTLKNAAVVAVGTDRPLLRFGLSYDWFLAEPVPTTEPVPTRTVTVEVGEDERVAVVSGFTGMLDDRLGCVLRADRIRWADEEAQ